LNHSVISLLVQIQQHPPALAPAARQEWCDGVVAELNSGHLDIDKPEMMALPIVQYRPK